MLGSPVMLQRGRQCPAQIAGTANPCCQLRCKPTGPDAGSRQSAPQTALRAAVLDYEAPAHARPPPSSGQAIPNATSGRLIDNGSAFVEKHRIRAYECGPDQKTTIITVSNLLQVST